MHTQTLKLLVFDWDVTLANSVSQIVACKQFLANKYNLPLPTEEDVRAVLGTRFESAMTICFPTATTSLLDQLSDEFHDLMQQSTYQAPLFPGAYDMLVAFKKLGLKLAVATSKARVELDKALQFTNLNNIFDITCCGEEYEHKPSPAMLNYILSITRVEPGEALMIGDTTTDIIFAKNANMEVITVTFGAHSASKLSTEHPLMLISDWQQLRDYVKKRCNLTIVSLS